MKAQVSFEFIIFLGVVLFIFAVASFASLQANSGIVSDNEVTEARRMATIIAQEINIAVEVGDGYSHVFYLPELLRNGNNYSVGFQDGFVSVDWKSKSYILPVLSNDINGNISKGQNIIKNVNDVITLE